MSKVLHKREFDFYIQIFKFVNKYLLTDNAYNDFFLLQSWKIFHYTKCYIFRMKRNSVIFD